VNHPMSPTYGTFFNRFAPEPYAMKDRYCATYQTRYNNTYKTREDLVESRQSHDLHGLLPRHVLMVRACCTLKSHRALFALEWVTVVVRSVLKNTDKVRNNYPYLGRITDTVLKIKSKDDEKIRQQPDSGKSQDYLLLMSFSYRPCCLLC